MKRNDMSEENILSEPSLSPACENCIQRTKKRSEEEYRTLMNRLKRIEGQVRGLERLLEEDIYCIDILTQVMAVNSALNSFSKELLSNHIKTCITNDILAGKTESVDELISILQKLMK